MATNPSAATNSTEQALIETQEKERIIPVENAVRVRNLVKRYYMGEVVVEALRGVNLEIRRGEYVSIVGPSGSGKTTLFNLIGGLDKPTEGRVYIDEVDIAQLDAYELAWLRCRKIGYIFQTFNLIPVMTALENVTLPMIFAGATSDEAIEKGLYLLELVGLKGREMHKPMELSGGQQQRVAIARALANDPSILLADEPTGNLDTKTGLEILALMQQLNKERGVTVIVNTHDLKMLDVSDRIVTMQDGRVAKIETREEAKLQVGRFEGEEVG
ncbi:MAG: putative ABC transporter ATP-binding protein [Candidatus Poribacteria bacterium]|nr:MAG: putative ABC transporter ATP-binding protein [Candidatus Poribacteria bacterium]